MGGRVLQPGFLSCSFQIDDSIASPSSEAKPGSVSYMFRARRALNSLRRPADWTGAVRAGLGLRALRHGVSFGLPCIMILYGRGGDEVG